MSLPQLICRHSGPSQVHPYFHQCSGSCESPTGLLLPWQPSLPPFGSQHLKQVSPQASPTNEGSQHTPSTPTSLTNEGRSTPCTSSSTTRCPCCACSTNPNGPQRHLSTTSSLGPSLPTKMGWVKLTGLLSRHRDHHPIASLSWGSESSS